jgi:predicted Na+-dependent transporter
MLYFLLAERNSPAEVRYMYLVLLLPITIGMVIVDLFLWRAIKKQRFWIWLIEAVLLLATIYFWIVKD